METPVIVRKIGIGANVFYCWSIIIVSNSNSNGLWSDGRSLNMSALDRRGFPVCSIPRLHEEAYMKHTWSTRRVSLSSHI